VSAWDEPKCVWCHKRGGELREIVVYMPEVWTKDEREVHVAVHPEHEEETRRFCDRVRRYGRTFLIAFLVAVPLLIAAVIFVWVPVLSFVLAYYGVLTLLFPFCTETTVELMGIHRSVRLARGAAAFLIALGILTPFME